MSAMLTADWFPLGHDSCYRKFEIYTMEWRQEGNMDNVVVVGAPYGGPIAVIRDKKKFVKVQSSGKPVIAIYSGSGKHISSLVWDRGNLVGMGWTEREHLLCIQENKSVQMYDMFGELKYEVTIAPKVRDAKAFEARVFTSVQGTGVALLTKSCRIFLVNNVYDAKTRQLAEMPKSDMSPHCWAVVSEDRNTDVLLARDRDLFRISDRQCLIVVPDISHKYTAILEIAVSLNVRHVALFTDAGYLWLGSTDLRTKYCEIDTDSHTKPKQLVWCGTDAVIAHWDNTVLVVGRQCGECVTFAYDDPVHLVTEIDGVRVLTASQHELIQKVPSVVQKIFRINSTEPGSFLLEASKQYQKRSHRADEYISLVRNNLELAVMQCIDAAGYEFEADTQKMLIRAAQFGKCFLENFNPDKYVNMCRILRVLNAVRDRKIGIPITFFDARYLTYGALLDRLVTRKHYYLAIRVAEYLQLPEQEGTSRILSQWASYKVAQTNLDEDSVAKAIADKLGYTSGVSYSQIADTAHKHGRNKLAIKLLDYEPRARLQVPLLLQLDEYKAALVKAIESGDTDLIYTVILHMKEHMTVGNLRLQLREFPVAHALYKKYCQEQKDKALKELLSEADDFGALALASLQESLEAKDSSSRNASLMTAQNDFRKSRNDLAVSLCDEALRLYKVQEQYENTYTTKFTGKSVHETCAKLLSLNDIKAADRFKSDFKIPDRRYWWLRIRSLAELQNWDELEKFSKAKKSPIGYGPFVDVCVEQNNYTEAKKYLLKVSDEFKIKYYVKAKLYDDAAKLAFDQKDIDGLMYIQRRCGFKSDISEKINSYITQLNSKK